MIPYSHTPVLLNEIVEFFNFPENTVYVDGTLGLGGHAAQMLSSIPSLQVIVGSDADALHLQLARERLEKENPRHTSLIFIHDWFHKLSGHLKEKGLEGKVTSLLLDLGICAAHFDNIPRGFSFKHDAPLDMRFNGNQEESAAHILNTAPEAQLADIFFFYGEEKRARILAKAIVQSRQASPYITVSDFLKTIEEIFWKKADSQTLARLFQALRIAVNNELQEIKDILNDLENILAPGGRIAIIAYHSLEDRIVKQKFKEYATSCFCPKEQPQCTCKDIPKFLLTPRKAIIPSKEEIQTNPKSRSAKLRFAIKNPNFYLS